MGLEPTPEKGKLIMPFTKSPWVGRICPFECWTLFARQTSAIGGTSRSGHSLILGILNAIVRAVDEYLATRNVSIKSPASL